MTSNTTVAQREEPLLLSNLLCTVNPADKRWYWEAYYALIDHIIEAHSRVAVDLTQIAFEKPACCFFYLPLLKNSMSVKKRSARNNALVFIANAR